MKRTAIVDGRTFTFDLTAAPDGSVRVESEGRIYLGSIVRISDGDYSLILEGRAYRVLPGEPETVVNGKTMQVLVEDPRERASGSAGGAAQGPQTITAPMPGKVVRLLAGVGDSVEAGQALVVIEAMKMQNEMRSHKKGCVTALPVAEGATVSAGDVLAVVE